MICCFIIHLLRNYYYFAFPGAVAKYCNEHVCVCVSVCLSARISPEPNGRSLPNFYACCLWLWLGPLPAGWRNPKKEGTILGSFFLTDNALYSIAFGTHTKTAEPIDMPFGMMSGLGPSSSTLRGGDDSQRGRGNFRGKHVPDKPNTPISCELDWSMQRRAHDRGRRLIASVGRVYYRPRTGGIAHRGRSLISTIVLLLYFIVFTLCII